VFRRAERERRAAARRKRRVPWERVEDPWHANYIGAPADGSVWIEGGDTRYWTLRGGAWNFPHAYLTASFRSNVLNTTPTRLSFYGFRVARDLER
jgi:formylglycine-generating enzyme required for sulfatase activity